MGIK
jgi:hypothetical protein